MSVGDFIRGSQVWKSIFRHPAPRDRRNRVVVMLTNVFLHLHPVSVRKSGIALSYTWCMGGLTFFLFLVETVTGVLLDRKSTRLNSSHVKISYAVFCLKKKK